MSKLPEIHLCIQQPPGYVHALGLRDQARYFSYQFRRLGAHVTVAKNRLRHDAVNFVFGAHLGFDAGLRERHACIFVNLEQLGAGGAPMPSAYLTLLANSAVVDYDPDNRAAYTSAGYEMPVAPLLYAPYLKPAHAIPLEERPIDLLFIGGMNERRKAWIDRIEALGLTVTVFDEALYADERDEFIVRSKAVLNAHFYESSRFEQARAAHCLSLGTPIISERCAQTRPHAAFEDSVLWLEGGQLEEFFANDFGTPAYYALMAGALAHFEQVADPVEAYADLLAFAAGFVKAHHAERPTQAWQPERINLGSGKDYQAGWLNLDVIDRAEPDLLLDLAAPLELPLLADSITVGPLRLEEGSVSLINANNVLEHVADLPALMGNCLRLLKTDGEFHIEVPYERALTAWQDPTHVRAMNENSWVYYTDWFWYLGWFEYRFHVERSTYLDMQLKECAREQAAFMRLALRKVPTTLKERTVARTLQADLRLPEDAVDARYVYRPRATVTPQPATPVQQGLAA